MKPNELVPLRCQITQELFSVLESVSKADGRSYGQIVSTELAKSRVFRGHAQKLGIKLDVNYPRPGRRWHKDE